ncbi:endonuclease III domain-containing protein [Candidatus Margulisiibacteriota bacterium]
MAIYNDLLNLHGPQGWWPLLKTESGKIISWYHKQNYSYPKTTNQQYEICLGAILTQNTSWTNVEKALTNLYKYKSLHPEKISKLNETELSSLIKSAGYYNQKAKKLNLFTDYFLKLKGKVPTRNDLINIWGIGPETADSMLLYAYKVPTFLIDAYTKRLFVKLGLVKPAITYHELKNFFEENLKNDLIIFQEFHALIVKQAKIK